MPLYTYRCLTCGAELEVLHRTDQLRTRCGLDCQLKGAGDFGKGEVDRVVAAPHVAVESRTIEGPSPRELRRAEARRQAALARMGGGLSEAEIGKLKKGGLSVYRRDSDTTWRRDGGAGEDGAPETITKPGDP